jgi:hypothetical protein
MKDRNSDFRRSGRNSRTYARRIRSGYRRQLAEVGDQIRPPVTRTKERQKVNWRVRSERGEVVAIEPNRDYEHVFEGGDDDFMAALEYAAKQLREGTTS